MLKTSVFPCADSEKPEVFGVPGRVDVPGDRGTLCAAPPPPPPPPPLFPPPRTTVGSAVGIPATVLVTVLPSDAMTMISVSSSDTDVALGTGNPFSDIQ